MTRADVELLERAYRLAWRDHEFDRAVSGVDDDFEWVVPGHLEGDVHRGREGVLEFYRELVEPFEDVEFDWELREAGPDRVLALCEMRGRGRGSGVGAQMRLAQLWTFRDGRPVRMVAYTNPDEGLAAAGLAE